MSKVINGGLDQYGAEPFEWQQFGRVGVEGVKVASFNVLLMQLCAIRHTYTS